MKNTYKFRRHVDIGNLAAEDDDFLMRAFVQKSELNFLKNIESTGSILLGRTGIGKSGLILYLEKTESDVVRIEPEAMSLRHLSNSTILSYFRALDVKMDLFFKVLWRHVFIVELIKMRFHGQDQSTNVINWLKDKFRGDKKREKALKYLEKWEHHFWENTEHRIREIEQGLEDRFSKELAGNASLYNLFKTTGRISEETTAKQNIKSELIHKAQKVVNESQIEEIRDIMQMMSSDIFTNTQKRYFVLIDDLDKDWVDQVIVYDLIKALIEVVNEFRHVKTAKIVIALRSNILKRVFHQNLTRGVQREKQKHLYIDLNWSSEELKNLLNNRLKELMKGEYTNNYPTTDDIFPESTSRFKDGFSYILDRTLMRPRDVIDFFNKCIKYADGKTKISRDILRQAEDEYSHERLQALNDEWFENYGSLFVLYSFIKGSESKFTINDVLERAKEHFIDQISKGNTKELSPELNSEFEKFGNDFEVKPLLEKVLGILIEIGLLGVKASPDRPIEYSFHSYSSFRPEDISEETKFYVHAMFHKALRIKGR